MRQICDDFRQVVWFPLEGLKTSISTWECHAFSFMFFHWFQILGRLQSFIGPPNRWSPFNECLYIPENFSIVCKSSQISTNTWLYWRMQCLFLNKVKIKWAFLTMPSWSITTCHPVLHILWFWWAFGSWLKFFCLEARFVPEEKCYYLTGVDPGISVKGEPTFKGGHQDKILPNFLKNYMKSRRF